MSKDQESQLEEELDVNSRDSNSEHVCYAPEDILEETSKNNNSREKYSLGFEKEIPFRDAPPFFQAPPRRYNNSNNYSSE